MSPTPSGGKAGVPSFFDTVWRESSAGSHVPREAESWLLRPISEVWGVILRGTCHPSGSSPLPDSTVTGFSVWNCHVKEAMVRGRWPDTESWVRRLP